MLASPNAGPSAALRFAQNNVVIISALSREHETSAFCFKTRTVSDASATREVVGRRCPCGLLSSANWSANMCTPIGIRPPTRHCIAPRKAGATALRRWRSVRRKMRLHRANRSRARGYATGSRTVARAPSQSSRLRRRISPPWARAICCANARPTPLPLGLVV